MLKRSVLFALSFSLVAVPSGAGAALLDQTTNPWPERRVLNIAHQGGEIEAPSNTLFAFKTALEKGADVLELDVHATSDRELVVIHDATVDRTTDGSGRIDQMTLEEVKALDAAHWFVPDCGTCHDEPDDAYAYRGFATGARPIPAELSSFEPNDFTIPTLREVLETFPKELINIEIKSTAPETTPYERELADLLAEFGRTTDTIVVSFLDHAVEAFKIFAPDVSTATGTGETGAFWATTQGPLPGAPSVRHHALQVPIEFNGITVVTPEFIVDAHNSGYAVHVWTINDADTMRWLIACGVDGIMTDRPTLLEEILGEMGVKYKTNGKKPKSKKSFATCAE
jgi:glycerophosphoryl diester phosphodiesterase